MKKNFSNSKKHGFTLNLKLPLVMRISLLLLFFVAFQLNASVGYAQKTNVSISTSNKTVEEILNTIEQSSDYVFLFNNNTVNTSRVVASKKVSREIPQILKHVFEGTNTVFTIVDKQIILSTKKQVINAQQDAVKTVSGTVTDETGEPLIGVSVQIKGTPTGSITDFDGNFTVKASVGSTLVFSYVGYSQQEVKVKGTNLNVVLKEDTEVLDEVVVTALGIKKEKKALTYNVQEIKSDEIVGVKDANFMNSLAGKIAGVQINTSSSGIGGAARVVMRGTSSISGDNNAMYVVDGIPLPSLKGNQENTALSGMGQSGDGIAAINPDDIESMSVLSGAAAAALYGYEAGNGVIMITTKKGKEGKLSVNLSNSTTFSSPFVMPKFQNTYGSKIGSYESWGEKLATPTDYDPADFFQTGYNVTNSVSLSTGSKTNQTYFSMSSVDARGLIPNNELERANVSFRNSSTFFNDRLNLDLSFMYMNVKEQNMLSQGQYFNPLIPIYLFPRGDDIDKYKTYERYNPERNFKTQYWPYGEQGLQMQNPYWIVNRDMFNNDKNRYLISGALKFDINKDLNITARVKYDDSRAVNERKYHASTSGLFAGKNGAYARMNIDDQQLYADVMLNFDKYIGDFSITAVLGASIKDTKNSYAETGGNLHGVANLFTYKNLNLSELVLNQSGFEQQNQAIFGTAQIGYKSMVYLDLTARNDWNSALAYSDTKSIFYPSVGLSAILTDMFPIKSEALSFLKVRGSCW